MAAASAANAPKAASRSRAPKVNLFDMPELMPGASPSANPAQKEEFQQRCRQLHRDEETDQNERAQEATAMRAAAGGAASANDLEAMFPMLDAALVRTLLAEAATPQHAIETLLALSAELSDPVVGEQGRPTSPPPRNLGVEDHDKFPTLVDSGGWQVVNSKQLEQDTEELGSAWRDRAKAAADIPQPRAAQSSTQAPAAVGQQRRKQSRQKDDADEHEQQDFLTDYDFRHSAGQRRAQHKVQYGRGGRSAAARGRGAAHGGQLSADASSSEGEEEQDAAGP